MKISLDWLGDFIKWKEPFGSAQGRPDPHRIAERITACTAEVEEVEVQGALLENCCVGKILSVEKHPNADKLLLCDVKTVRQDSPQADQGTKRVVCGGTNLREGMRVAFAHIGAQVRWHGEELMTLEKTKIRGEESEGMICAAEELDLMAQFPDAVGRNIIDLGDGDEGVGQSLREFLGFTDVVLDIDNHAITHRADLFSHVGFARECVAIGLATWKKKPEYKVPSFTKDSIPFKCKVDIEELVPRYCCCMLSIDGVGETPDWMRRRLEATGGRSLNLPIDITNYVALEVGMPLHSFNVDDLQGDVHFRTTKKGEKIVTLDEVERELPEGAIVLSDDKGIFDLMGVMGGLRSSTKDGTKRIYLHSAVVDPVSIRRTIIATGHRTDASTVYEKGIPKVAAEQGFYRALELFLELVPGATIISKMDSWGDNGKPQPIDLSQKRVGHVLGVDIPEKKIEAILGDLEFDVQKKKDQLVVTPPLFRLGDITGEHDLIEEVGRIYGYDNIESVMPVADITPPERDFRIHVLRRALKEQGYFELRPLSLVGASLLKKAEMDPSKAVEIANSIGEEYSLMRTSTLPSLLEHAEHNILQVEDVLCTFEWGHVFEKGKEEHLELGMLVASRVETGLKHDPFLFAKQNLSYALQQLGYAPAFRMSKQPPSYAHPGRCAGLLVGDTVVGQLFEVHPTVRERFDLPNRAAAVLLDLSVLFDQEVEPKVSKPVPQFPAITYDVTITMDHAKRASDVLEKIRKTSELLESVEVADMYEGEPLKKGQYNLTLRCTYRAPDRTLTEDEVKKEHDRVASLAS